MYIDSSERELRGEVAQQESICEAEPDKENTQLTLDCSEYILWCLQRKADSSQAYNDLLEFELSTGRWKLW